MVAELTAEVNIREVDPYNHWISPWQKSMAGINTTLVKRNPRVFYDLRFWKSPEFLFSRKVLGVSCLYTLYLYVYIYIYIYWDAPPSQDVSAVTICGLSISRGHLQFQRSRYIQPYLPPALYTNPDASIQIHLLWYGVKLYLIVFSMVVHMFPSKLRENSMYPPTFSYPELFGAIGMDCVKLEPFKRFFHDSFGIVIFVESGCLKMFKTL